MGPDSRKIYSEYQEIVKEMNNHIFFFHSKYMNEVPTEL